MDVIIVCHTEFGFVRKGTIIYDKKAVQGVEDGVLDLIKLAEKYRAKITFAVCPEAASFFPKNIKHEIGLHIHPGHEQFNSRDSKWTVGDSYLKTSKESTVLKDYSYEEQLEIINKGKKYLKEVLNADPKVFVAGRWSLNNDTIKALTELGLTHDCSAYPGLRTDYLDWSKLPRICMPYKPSRNDYQVRGDAPILIVPVSRMFLKGIAGPEDIKKCGFKWLKACFLEYYKQGVPLFHIALHSPIMTDPYYISALDNFLSFIIEHENINFKFVSEIKEYPEKKLKTKAIYYLKAVNKEIISTVFKKILNK